jgi:hypothetical protein
VTESRMAEAVFDGLQLHSNEEHRAPHLKSLDLRTAAIVETSRLRARRRLTSNRRITERGASRDLPCTILRRSHMDPGFVLVFDLSVVHLRDVVDRSIAALHCRLPIASWPRKLAHVRGRIAEILASVASAAQPVAASLANGRADSIRREVLQGSQHLAERARSLQKASDSAARQLVQAGLFERPRPSARPRNAERSLLAAPDVQAATGEVTSTAQLCALLVVLPR